MFTLATRISLSLYELYIVLSETDVKAETANKGDEATD